MSDYPAVLPTLTRDQYAINPQSNTVRTDLEAGPARVRRRFTTAPVHISATWLFFANELAIFESWFARSCDGGAAFVGIPLINGLGISTVQARFIDSKDGPYQVKANGARWEVTAQLETLSMPTMADWDYRFAVNPDLAAGTTPTLALDFTSDTYQVWSD